MELYRNNGVTRKKNQGNAQKGVDFFPARDYNKREKKHALRAEGKEESPMHQVMRRTHGSGVWFSGLLRLPAGPV